MVKKYRQIVPQEYYCMGKIYAEAIDNLLFQEISKYMNLLSYISFEFDVSHGDMGRTGEVMLIVGRGDLYKSNAEVIKDQLLDEDFLLDFIHEEV